jgi:hypothetical protein
MYICAFRFYLFKFQIAFSSLYEVICPFTRDYDSIRAKLQTIEEWDKTHIEGALHGVNNVIMAEWGNATACQVILITDGNPGVGRMSLSNSLNSLNVTQDVNPFPLPFPYPGKLSIVCLASQQGKLKYNCSYLFHSLFHISKRICSLTFVYFHHIFRSKFTDCLTFISSFG